MRPAEEVAAWREAAGVSREAQGSQERFTTDGTSLTSGTCPHDFSECVKCLVLTECYCLSDTGI